MVLFGLLDRRSAREGTEPLPTPVPQSKWSSFKSKLSRRRHQPTEDPMTSTNIRVHSDTTPDRLHHEEPDFFHHTASRNAEDNYSLGSRPESSASSRPLTPSSEASSSLSKYNYMFFAPLRASMVDETGSVEHESPLLESQEDDGADRVVESLLPQAPIITLDPAAPEAPVRLVEGIERSSMAEYEPACALECFIAKSLYGGDDISACLRGGSAAQSRRAAFSREDTPVVTKSSQAAKILMASEDVDTRSVTDSTANDLQPANMGSNKSASDESKPSSVVAPVATSLSKETSSLASPMISEDYPESLSTSSSLRGNDLEKPFTSPDFVNQNFAAAKHESSRVSGSTKNCGRWIKTEANLSAGGEDGASPTAAPIGSPPLSHRQTEQAPSFSTFSTNGSVGNNCRTVDGNRNESAGPSVADAPVTSIPLSRLKPRKVARDAALPVWSQVPHHAREIKLRITSKLRQWGNGASNVLK
ncbi:hypothetical protein FS837_005724, partial [Tulasnella sp. UAMH 9824]